MKPTQRSRTPRACIPLAVLALVFGTVACAKPLARGEGPTTVQIKLGQFETKGTGMRGNPRVEVIDYEDECPKRFGPRLYKLRKFDGTVRADGDPLEFEVVPGHFMRLTLRHQSGGQHAAKTCSSRVWFRPEKGAHYKLTMHSDLASCSATEDPNNEDRFHAYATCEALAAATSTVAAE